MFSGLDLALALASLYLHDDTVREYYKDLEVYSVYSNDVRILGKEFNKGRMQEFRKDSEFRAKESAAQKIRRKGHKLTEEQRVKERARKKKYYWAHAEKMRAYARKRRLADY